MEMIKISEFKRKMGFYLKRVRSGGQIVLTDRDNPVATLRLFERAGAGTSRASDRGRDDDEPLLVAPKAGFKGVAAIRSTRLGKRPGTHASLAALLADRE